MSDLWVLEKSDFLLKETCELIRMRVGLSLFHGFLMKYGEADFFINVERLKIKKIVLFSGGGRGSCEDGIIPSVKQATVLLANTSYWLDRKDSIKLISYIWGEQQ